MVKDTIVAISTCPGESGIGIIRVSGNNAIQIVDEIYINKNNLHTLKNYKTHTIHYGYIIDSEKYVIDEVMVSIMKSPNSYTREDVVEINCHGGIRICRNILDLLIQKGARIAEPGEFTKRAFLNGRLDLTRAEAVMDAIKASSDIAIKSSVNQIRGSLYNKLNNICSDLLYEIAFIESALDDPDSISLDGYEDKLLDTISKISNDLIKLIKSYDEGKIISEGIKTVIIGKPNAGKSSLLNSLMEEERAIVTNIPGTTRDTLTETIKIGQAILKITDTAGIRQTIDPIENIGVNKARNEISNSDLVLLVCDSSEEFSFDDLDIVNLLADKNIIVLLNKIDLESITNKEKLEIIFKNNNIQVQDIIECSIKNNQGIEELKQTINELFFNGKIYTNEEIIITNLRHIEHLKNSLASLEKVKQSINNGYPEDFYSIDLTDAYSSLAKITGAEVSEDIVNEIFSKFCMGK